MGAHYGLCCAKICGLSNVPWIKSSEEYGTYHSYHSHTRIVHCLSNIQSVYNLIYARFNCFLSRAISSPSPLVRCVYKDSSHHSQDITAFLVIVILNCTFRRTYCVLRSFEVIELLLVVLPHLMMLYILYHVHVLSLLFCLIFHLQWCVYNNNNNNNNNNISYSNKWRTKTRHLCWMGIMCNTHTHTSGHCSAKKMRPISESR